MNIIEERIRSAARAAGNTVSPDSVPPLELPAERSWAAGWRRRWLVPAAAAAAVIVVAVAAVTVGQVVRTRTPGYAPAATAPGPMVPGPSLASYVSSGMIPPYFVALASTGKVNLSPTVAVVHDTVSGRTLATIKPSIRGGTIQAVSAAGDDRTFVLDEQPWVKPGGPPTEQWHQPRSFYLLRLNSAGQVSSLSRLWVTVPAKQVLDAFALSPDGKRLALAIQPHDVKQDPNRIDLIVYTLGNGTARAWNSDGVSIGSGPDDPLGLSWTADGRTLTFLLLGNAPDSVTAVRLLNLASADGDLLAASRRVMSLSRVDKPSGSVIQPEDDAIITPDGSAIVSGMVFWQVKKTSKGQPSNVRSGFAEYSAETGKAIRILGYWTIKAAFTSIEVLWSSPSGRVLIGIAAGNRIGVINGNEFTPLNMPPVQPSVIGAGAGLGAGAW
jgi:hypothetical protein